VSGYQTFNGVTVDDRSATANVSVIVNPINDAPVITSVSFSASENQTAVGTAAATDADTSETLTYTLTGTDASSFSINSASGVITFNSAPDYETKVTYSVTLNVSDGTNTTSTVLTIIVTNVNEASPVITSSSTFSAAENQTAVDTVTATGADTSDTLTYTLTGTDASSLSINSASGVITFNSAPDYETKATYSVTLNVSDGTNTTSQALTINVTDVNEASPVITSSSTFSAFENQTAVGTATATDADTSDTLTYTLTGTDASSLSINSSSGVITFNSAPNYESKSSYSVTVTVSDGTNTTTQDITITVTDVNDSPVATAASYYMNLRPQSQTTGYLTLAGTDEDGDSLTYSIVSNGAYGVASLNGSSITYQTDADTQSAQTESFTFKVNDGTVDSSAATISIDLRTDPLYQYQWHLNNTGQTSFASNSGTAGADLNIDTVIASGKTGEGVVVAVVDTGLEIAHEDLTANVVSNGSYNYLNGTNDPSPTGSGGDHGTMVAGIIASKGWNNKGGRGVAPNASLVAFNLLLNMWYVNEVHALGGSDLASDVSIFNMSYGGSTLGSAPFNPSNIYLEDLAPLVVRAQLESGATTLRGGKGALYVNASGNDYYNGDSGTGIFSYCGDGANASTYKVGCYDAVFDSVFEERYIIGVGALDADYVKTKYSTPGASLWVSAFGGDFGVDSSYTAFNYSNSTVEIPYKPAILTTDRSSCTKGYNSSSGYEYNALNDWDNPHSSNPDCNYTNISNGTSSAAPMVSGVIALMLEANADLNWREVKHILATEAVQVDASFSASAIGGIDYVGWVTNAAGFKFHPWYGFGAVDATAAVNSAASFTAGSLGSESVTSWNDSSSESETIPDLTIFTRNITESGSGTIEHVKVRIAFGHSLPNTLGFRLQSPSGTVSTLLPPLTAIQNNPTTAEWVYLPSNAFYGETKEGVWKLVIIDHFSGTTGTFALWGINFTYR
jgi:subtilisin family serine protease